MLLLLSMTLLKRAPQEGGSHSQMLSKVHSSAAQLPSSYSLTRQSLSRGPVHPAAHWLWQQSLGDLPRQRREHCWAQMILVTEKERSPVSCV